MASIAVEIQSEIEPDNNSSVSLRRSKRPVTLKFEDVVYKIKTKTMVNNGDGEGKKTKHVERKILNGVSGFVLPGEMIAIMGPSGSGKTTLLTALGGRACDHRSLSGTVTYNGMPFSGAVKRSIGYVTQDDKLYEHLTVAETLLYTAFLRLPDTLCRAEKAEISNKVIEQLGLSTCRNNIIGGPMLRGVSGGERKRVCIGQEMLIDPGLIFLDEPTSGLDSTTALKTISVMDELAKGGRAVVMTIHQPSSRLYYMFDKILLLSDGNPLYFGKCTEALDYFAGIGYVPPAPMNPADFLLDLANGVCFDEIRDVNQKTAKENLANSYNLHMKDQVKHEVHGVIIERRYCQRNENKSYKKIIESSNWSASWWTQFTVLLQRGMKERRHQAFSYLKISQIVLSAFVCGLIWWHSGTHTVDQVGLLFLSVAFWSYLPLFDAIYTFPQELVMLMKERSSGMYRLSAYFLSRTLAELPMDLALPIVFSAIVYFMTGLKLAVRHFCAYVAAIILSILVSNGLGLALGAIVMDPKKASTMAAVIVLGFSLLGGFYVQHIPAYFSWVKYISIQYYSFKMLLISQYKADETYRCGENATCRVADIPSVKAAGLDHIRLSVGVMVAMFVLYRLVAYVALMKIGAPR